MPLVTHLGRRSFTHGRSVSLHLNRAGCGSRRTRPSRKHGAGRVGFRRLLGDRVWTRLPAAIRARFRHRSGRLATVTYRGTMTQVRVNLPGWILAQACRLFGTPIAPFRGAGVPTDVHVYDDGDGVGTVWAREYRFPGRAPVRVQSIKCADDDGTLLECLGAGLRMRLRVFEDGGCLHFLSTGYFFEIGPLRVPLPRWFPPGSTHVVHGDEGGRLFRFTMSVDHPWFGRMFFQDGLFRAEGDRA